MLPAIGRTLTRLWQGCFQGPRGASVGHRQALRHRVRRSARGPVHGLCHRRDRLALRRLRERHDRGRPGRQRRRRAVEYWVQYGRPPRTAPSPPTRRSPSGTSRRRVGHRGRRPRALHDLPLPALRARRAAAGGPGCGADRTSRRSASGAARPSRRRCGYRRPRMLALRRPVVGAAGIDVNLAGHGRRSDLRGRRRASRDLNSAGHDDVTVRNGRVFGWGNSVQLEGASRNRIRDVTAGRVRRDLIEGGEDNEIRASSVNGRTRGFGGGLRPPGDRGHRGRVTFGAGISIAGDRDHHAQRAAGGSRGARASRSRAPATGSWTTA